MDIDELLRQYGRRRALPHHGTIFGDSICIVSKKIRNLYPFLEYDFKPYALERSPDFEPHHTEEFRRGYVCFKYAVSAVLQPKTIVEIGIGAGVAALAFLHASPQALYIGIDDGTRDRELGGGLTEWVKSRMEAYGFNHRFIMANTLTLDSIPHGDLIHVDGGHSDECAYNDVKLALRSGAPWILIDDCRDRVVMKAAFAAIKDLDSGVTWSYFEDTWTGNLLLCNL